MRKILGLFIFVMIGWFAKGQNATSFEQQLAVKIGVCDGKYSYPCKSCKFKFVALAPSKAKDQLFFMETVSPGHCGSGGCTGTVYVKSGHHYREVLNVFGFFEKPIPRNGQAPDLVYLHVEFPKRDYDRDGKNDKATIKVRYRWNDAQQAFDVIDILSIDVFGKEINPTPWRKQLIREWQSGSPWVN